MWTAVILALAVFSYGDASSIAPRAGCTVDANGAFPAPDPIFLRPGGNFGDAIEYKNGYVVPDKKTGLINFDVGEIVRVACPGNTLQLSGVVESNVTCVGSNQFQIGSGSPFTIDKLKCRSSTTDKALRTDKCAKTGTGVNIGFQLDTFFPLIYVCFDEKTLETYYSQEIVPAELKGYQSGGDRPSFKADDFYSFDVDEMYTQVNQLDAFTKLLGSSALAKQYIKDSTNYFLARGHFAPRADFIFESHNRATFHFINVGPQWQIFNGGVWNNLEMATRDYAIDSGKDVIAYTGPLGVLSYPDINDNPVELYLANPGTSQQSIKVPKFYFKILVDPASKEGVAFVGINDPYVAKPYPKDYVICTDVLSKINWLDIKDTTLLYACEVADFVKNNPNLPAIEVTGLLTD